MAAVAGISLLASPAAAPAAEEGPSVPDLLEPADGAQIPAGSSVRFELRSSPSSIGGPWLHVSNSARPGSDGVIDSDVHVAELAQIAEPAVWAHAPPSRTYKSYFLNSPGTYHWQAYRIDCGNFPGDCHLESEVRSFTIVGRAGSSPEIEPAASPPGPARLWTDPIPSSIGTSAATGFQVNDTVGPAGVDGNRFRTLAVTAGARWGLAYRGRTARQPVFDGKNVVAFHDGVRELEGEPLAVEIQWTQPAYRRGKTRCKTYHDRRGRKRRRCRKGSLKFVGHLPTGERDVAISTDPGPGASWAQGPDYPTGDEYDLETILLHELGHFAGNAEHASEPCANTPLWEALAAGDWWHSPTDWSRVGCGSLAKRSAAARPSGTIAVKRVPASGPHPLG